MKISDPVLLAILLGLVSQAMSAEKSASDQESSASQSDMARLKTVKVEATTETATGPVEGYSASRSATGTRTDTPLLETPVSVQVVGRELMDDQQVLTLGDAVKNISGVYTRQGPDGNTMDAFNIRGFQVDSYGGSYTDGMKDFSRAPKETAGLERVEVLKGPAAIMYGRIEPGGMINRVNKKPLDDEFLKVQQQLGSHSYWRTTVDANGDIADEDNLLYRVNLALEDGDGFKQDMHNRRAYLAPQFEWHAGESTDVRAGVEYQENYRSWALTYGTIGNDQGPVDIPVSTNLHDKDDHYEDDSLSVNLNWQHRFNNTWQIQQRITYVDRNSVAKGSLLTAANTEGNYTRSYWGWDDEQAQIASTNIDLQGKFATGGVTHTLLAGIDYFDEDYNSGGWSSGGTGVPTNVHDPDRDSAPYDLDRTINEYWYKNLNTGVYLQDQMAMLNERLHLLLGVRYDDAEYDYFYGTTPRSSNDNSPTWRAGLLYKLADNASVYTSYVEGFGATNFSAPPTPDGKVEKFDPQTSNQYEVGTKWELTPDLGLTLAVFRLIKDNLTMTDPADPTQKRIILAGEATSEGVELDFGGAITENWSLTAAYAYTDVRYTRSDRFQGERLHSVPYHGASLWNRYNFGASGWTAGAGVTYRSERLAMQRATRPELYPYNLDAYTLIDLMLAYEFTAGHWPIKAQINVSNATDEVYHPSSYGSPSRIALGTPRNVLAAISMHF
jgi:iron complex outermembrane receptor protein